jgi:hypothetical protein
VANNIAVNRTELLHECNERFGKSITRTWADSFLTRFAEQLFKTKSVPQKNPRLEVPRVFLQARLDGFRGHVHQPCAELVFNLDEIGISEWEDRCTRRVIVPSVTKGQTIFHVVHLRWVPNALLITQKSERASYSKRLLTGSMEQKASGFQRLAIGDESWSFPYYLRDSVWAESTVFLTSPKGQCTTWRFSLMLLCPICLRTFGHGLVGGH